MISSLEMASIKDYKNELENPGCLISERCGDSPGVGAVLHHGDKPQQTRSGITIRTTGGCKEESQSLFDTKFH